MKRDKTTLKSPWDPEPYEVVEVKGSKVTAQRGAQHKARAKNHKKVVKEIPDFLRRPGNLKKKTVNTEEEEDLDVNMATIRRMTRPKPANLPNEPGAQEPEQQDGGGEDDQDDQGPGPGPGRVGRLQYPGRVYPDWGAQKEAVLRSRSSSASSAGRIRKAPNRYGFEEVRDTGEKQEDELQVQEVFYGLRALTPMGPSPAPSQVPSPGSVLQGSFDASRETSFREKGHGGSSYQGWPWRDHLGSTHWSLSTLPGEGWTSR